MPKRKNHTGRNATVKAHANGIKKAKNHKHTSLKGKHTYINTNTITITHILTIPLQVWIQNFYVILDTVRSITKRIIYQRNNLVK